MGTYVDANNVSHGFLRDSNGTFTTFDVPGALQQPFSFATVPIDISPDRTIFGGYVDVNFDGHGFLRTASGAFTEINGPGGTPIGIQAPFSQALNLGINPEGVITGTYFEPISGNPFGGNYRVFVRAPDGTFTTFDAATYPPCCIWSFPSAINPAGTITGSFNDGFNVNHGFVRTSDGTVTTFDAPGAATGHGQLGTVPLSITPAGVIMGKYFDANNGTHGFLFLPQ
jgi:hypothetical protein